MDLRVRLQAEVREQQRLGMPRQDLVDARFPRLDIDVGRRRRRHDHVRRRQGDARDVADEGDPARLVVVGQVVRGMARRVGRLQGVAAGGDRFTTRQSPDIGRWDRFECSPQPVHRAAVQSCGAVEQFLRVDQVRRAALVDVERDARVLAEDGAAGASVIEVDVGEQDRVDVAEAQAAERQLLAQDGERAGGAGIDQRDAARAFDDRRRDDLRRALESEIQEPYAWRDDRHRARARVDPEVPVMPSSHPTIRGAARRRACRG